MATTKKQLAEQVLRIISGGHLKPDETIDIREIMLMADQMRDELIVETVNINGGLTIDPAFVSYYEDVVVNYDAPKNERYINLPATPIRLPKKLGVYSIAPMQNADDQFIPIPVTGSWLYKDTMAMENNVITKYFQVGTQVFFKNIDPTISLVLVGLVASSKDITESAVYPITPEIEAMLIKRLFEMFVREKQMPHDETENGQKNS